MDNKGGESLQLIKGEASQPPTLQVLECVPQHATSNQGSGKAQKKRHRLELSPEKRERKRVADKKSKAKSKEKQEEIKSQRDELETENKLLRQEMHETLMKQIDKLERQNEELKHQSREKEQQLNSRLEELHSLNKKLEGELREKEEERMNLAKEKFEAEKKQLETNFELRMLKRQLLQSPPALDPDNLMKRQSYTEQPKSLGRDANQFLCDINRPSGISRSHCGSDSFQAAGIAHAHIAHAHESNFHADPGTDALFAGLSIVADFSSLSDFSPQQQSIAVQAHTP